MLKTETIGDYVVSEAGAIEAARAAAFGQTYQAMISKAQAAGENVSPDELDRLTALSMWPNAGACVSPRVDADAWLNIPLETIVQIVDAAKRLNPSWFEPMTDGAKKKKRR